MYKGLCFRLEVKESHYKTCMWGVYFFLFVFGVLLFSVKNTTSLDHRSSGLYFLLVLVMLSKLPY